MIGQTRYYGTTFVTTIGIAGRAAPSVNGVIALTSKPPEVKRDDVTRVLVNRGRPYWVAVAELTTLPRRVA